MASFLSRVRVVESKRDQRKLPILFFYGRIQDLDWDSGRLSWNMNTNFLSYTIQLGREILCNCHTPLQLVDAK
jgi:hypothetical protein